MPHAKKIDQVALSPDGTQVAYIVNGTVTVTPLGGGPSQPITLGEKLPLRDVAWSADSKHFALIADLPGDVPVAQVWTAAIDGSDAAKLAEVKGYVQAPRFSPDGSKLAILFTEDLPRVAGPLQPMTPLAGVVNQKIYEQRITTIDLGARHVTQVTPADVYVYEYDWTPDGQAWAATAAHGSGDANWWIARLYWIDAGTGKMREIYAPKLQIAEPRVSPDGSKVAFFEGLMSDQGVTGGDIHVVPIAGGVARNLTPNIKASPSSLAWSAPERITFAQNVDGKSGFGTVSAGESTMQTIWTGEEFVATNTDGWVPGGSFSRDGSVVAVVRQSAGTPPEAWAGPIGRWKQITNLNAGVKPAWGDMRIVHWMSESAQVRRMADVAQRLRPGQDRPPSGQRARGTVIGLHFPVGLL